ncbi:molybdopterin molybdotransferase MoeA [Janibacter melonis]|uniref:molybdopterin molybdotransferase MoeA n=1 Tax=Janibacter melonis TaxID=262209 RepID=UPI0020941E69|nr:gephyrin-like molybdotransferase Glp [Janibacter melonis]
MSTTRELLTLEQYVAEVLRLVPGPTPVEVVALDDAHGRVLAGAVTARGQVPAFANSAMDGYAVRWADVADAPVELAVVGEVPAGSPPDPAIGPGECVRIMTGAPVPGDADTIVPVELTDGGEQRVHVTAAPERGQGAHVRGAGEDLQAGDLVAEPGTTLTARVLSSVAAAGHAEVPVRRRPVVAVAATGDELVAPGGALGRGQVYESNATHLAATAREQGADVVVPPTVRDDAALVVRALDELAAQADVAVLTGGASVGAYDVARDVLTEHAGATYRHVRVQPGKPQGWALWQGTPVVALPGNPVSAAISFEVVVRPLLDALLGRAPRPTTRAVAATGWRSPPGRRQLVPVRITQGEDLRPLATPSHRRGSASHMVTSLAGADALAEVPEETTEVAPGDLLTIRSLA